METWIRPFGIACAALRVRAAALCLAAATLPAAPARALDPVAEGAAAEIVLSALGLLGVPYRPGSSDPAVGLDCSGLVHYVARRALGLSLPRQAESLSRSGRSIAPAELRPGDLVFFNTLGRAFSHVGIYLGDQRFVHAPALRGQVRVESMAQPYWRSRFDGARRLSPLDTPDGGPLARREDERADPFGLMRP